ncbi:hypothetical protein ACFYKX_14450 [Cytobacillus sp. FJAT-54145]|uniref:Uncharacterized protein n=1 Tax=Cytobacillus spartinae TaxID=3299023 RepID=A0ABW6KE12_9BACI
MEEVIYQDEIYLVLYKYSSGYWEIQKKDSPYIKILVHESEVDKHKQDS